MQNHLSSHHKILPSNFQVTDQAKAEADAHYNGSSNNDQNTSDTSTMAQSTSKLTLNDTLPLPNSSVKIPRLGFGVYLSDTKTCVASCTTALKTGYRHIDSAQYYQNEREVGLAISQYKDNLPRSEVFITTKILAAAGSVEKSYQKCLESVQKCDPKGTDGNGQGAYVDLFLIHSPNAGKEKRKEMWLALERLLEEGKTRAIGVSNFGVAHIEEMKEYAKVWPPHVNQIELHPWCQQRTICSYCEKNGIVIEAYSPLVRAQKSHDPTLVEIAKKHGKTSAQVLIRYCLQKGWVPLPKSDTPSRIEENANVYDFDLSKEEMETLDGLDEGADGSIVQAVTNE